MTNGYSWQGIAGFLERLNFVKHYNKSIQTRATTRATNNSNRSHDEGEKGTNQNQNPVVSNSIINVNGN